MSSRLRPSVCGGTWSRIGLVLTCLTAVAPSSGHTTEATQQSPVPTSNPTKRALVIAISEYGEPPPDPRTGEPRRGYGRLNSGNDTTLVLQALATVGFDRRHIEVIRDEAATAEGLRAAFGRLIEAAQPGDIVVVHFSGHGHQIADDDLPIEEPDGYDEVLVPHGSPAEFTEGYDGSLHLRDDEVGDYLTRLRRQVGPTGNVTVFLDSCFSGTGTRGTAVVRGMPGPLGPPASGSRRGPGFDGFDDTRATSRGNDVASLASYAVLSAASHRQFAYETTMDTPEGPLPVGSLSYAIAWSLPRLGPGSTYRDLHAQIKRAVSGKIDLALQTPQIEGQSDRILFSNQLRASPTWYDIESVLPGRRVLINGGTLVGLGSGARVEVFRADGSDTPAIAAGQVSRAEPLRALVELDAQLGPEAVGRARVMPTTLVHGSFRLRVAFSGPFSAPDLERTRARFDSVGVIEVVETDPDLRISADPAGAEASRARGGGVISRGTLDTVAGAVVRFARNQYLRQLHLSAEHIRARLELSPAEPALSSVGDVVGCGPARWEAAPSSDRFLGGDQWQMRPDDTYRLRVVNDSDVPVFATVVDLLPLGGTSVLVPGSDEAPGSLEVGPGLAFELGCFLVDPEPGHETLKLFATTQEVDLRPLFGGASRSVRGDLSALEILVDSRANSTRSSTPTAAGAGTTSDVHLHVVEPGGATPGGAL